MYKRILLAVDDSQNSQRAVDAVKAMGLPEDATVVLLNAYHIPSELAGLASQFATSDQYLEKIRAGIRAGGRTLLEGVHEQLADTVANVEMVLSEGRPGPTIVQTLDDENCDIAVLGKRGQGRVRQLLLGSASDYVVHHAKRPVLLVP